MTQDKKKWSNRNYIELDFFSGAPNPRWELTDAEVKDLLAEATRREQRGKAEDFLEPDSWYGGVILHVADATGPGRYLTVYNEHIFDSAGDLVLTDPGRVFERLLYEKAPDYAAALIDKMRFDDAILPVDEGVPDSFELVISVAQCPQAPSFEVAPPPVRWSVSPGKDDNNCYNYANDVFSDIDDALPGGVMKHEWTEREMHELVTEDGLVPVSTENNKQLPGACIARANAHLVAIFLRRRRGSRVEAGVAVPNYADFHCFRLDQGGVWSHKDGRKRSSQKDQTGTAIGNPSAAKFRLRHVLVGYYWTFPGPHRRIRTP